MEYYFIHVLVLLCVVILTDAYVTKESFYHIQRNR